MHPLASTRNDVLLRNNVTIFCEAVENLIYLPIMYKHDPTKYPLPLLMLQISLFTIFTAIFQFFLMPSAPNSFVPQLLGGIVLGPTFLGQNKKFCETLFSPKGVIVLQVFDVIGNIFLILLFSMKMNVSVIKKCGKLPFVIGITSFVFPIIITTSMAFFIRETIKLKDDVHLTLPMVAAFQSTTSFHVILGLLTDLKLLNSELGRVAAGSSLISGLCAWTYTAITVDVKEVVERKDAALLIQFTQIFLYVFIYVALRPIMLWMMRQTPEGKPLKEGYIRAIAFMVLGCAFYGEVTGQHFVPGPAFLGIVIPDSPPMGYSLMNKIGSFNLAVFMPCCLINIGREINLFVIGLRTFLVVEFLLTIATMVKLLAIVIPSLYYRMPFSDAVALALLLNCQGFFDIQIFNRARVHKLITDECFTIMLVTVLLHTTIFVKFVKTLYDPSKKFVAYRRRTIQHAKRNAELRILACIHQEDDVPTIINILEASNPTRESPIGIYVMNLEELVGRAIPELIFHRFSNRLSARITKVDRMMNAFRQYEQQNDGLVTLQCFTAAAPYATMHEDVCSMALEKNTSIVIIPFQKSDSPSVRSVNKHVIEKAPCSVGILYDHGALLDRRSIFSGGLIFNVCVVFIGGPDDREALAYGARMTNHPSIRLTVLRLVAYDQSSDMTERRHDLFMISDFRLSTMDNQHVKFKEERVTKVSDTALVLRSMDKDYDLIVVGRRHNTNSPLLAGLSEWSEFEELGVVGDLLASSDCKSEASVFVVQQQASFVEKMVEKPKYISQELH